LEVLGTRNRYLGLTVKKVWAGELRIAKESPWGRVLQLYAVVFAIAWFSQLLTWEVAPSANVGLLITAVLYALIFLVVFMLLRQGSEGFSNLGLRISGLGTFILLAAVLGIRPIYLGNSTGGGGR